MPTHTVLGELKCQAIRGDMLEMEATSYCVGPESIGPQSGAPAAPDNVTKAAKKLTNPFDYYLLKSIDNEMYEKKYIPLEAICMFGNHSENPSWVLVSDGSTTLAVGRLIKQHDDCSGKAIR
ncbi:hypothetical protein NDU88_005769 [Pleurodeles waltl]|uniref:Uncharacterized protein n=1 Tax=Pleurodeles waltl TaxID=8319 RepID=A0AAV7MBG5_PLEWA|nr:hypothetical protein NDU88_005769 [Pleurodeles waltl]